MFFSYSILGIWSFLVVVATLFIMTRKDFGTTQVIGLYLMTYLIPFVGAVVTLGYLLLTYRGPQWSNVGARQMKGNAAV